MIDKIISVMKAKGYAVFENDTKPFNINYVGIRDIEGINTFNDPLIMFWKYAGHWNYYSRPGTTDPGTYYLLDPINDAGTAILKEGQYRGAWELGLHKGYEALVQRKEVTVIRDWNLDGRLDVDSGCEDTGFFGINHHAAGKDSTQVDRWSAGCQVTANKTLYDVALQIWKGSAEAWGEGVTYTVLNKKDFM